MIIIIKYIPMSDLHSPQYKMLQSNSPPPCVELAVDMECWQRVCSFFPFHVIPHCPAPAPTPAPHPTPALATALR